MQVVLAPHADDEIIGCYSILNEIDWVIVFKEDYRTGATEWYPDRVPFPSYATAAAKGGEAGLFSALKSTDTVYLPSQYDYHPLHREVRRIGLALPGKKMFYSVEMNTPWLEEESDPNGKRELFEQMYPGEVATIGKSDKYFLFKSIKPFDEFIWAVVRFQREYFHRWPAAPEEVAFLSNLHRHLFHFEIRVQQFGDDRDLEYFILSRMVQKWVDTQNWSESTSCEMFALAIKRWLECQYRDRVVKVSVLEDGENGTCVE